MSNPNAAATAVTGVVQPVVEAANLFLESVKVSKAGNRTLVRITVDLPETETGSLASDDLETVSRAISGALDDDDVVPGAYVLEVSTPGATRPLTETRHFLRARGRVVALNLGDGTTRSARLTEVDGETLVFEDGTTVPLADVVKAKVELEFKRSADETTEETTEED